MWCLHANCPVPTLIKKNAKGVLPDFPERFSFDFNFKFNPNFLKKGRGEGVGRFEDDVKE